MIHAEINAAFTDKIRRGIVKPVARHLTDLAAAAAAEDRLQTIICMAWQMFARYVAEKNLVLSDAILAHSCRQRTMNIDVTSCRLAAVVGVETCSIH